MKIRKVLGSFAWVLLAALLIMVNAAAASSEGMFDQKEHSSVSSVIKCRKATKGKVTQEKQHNKGNIVEGDRS